MKQGRADHSNSSGVKREPISHAVDPGAVDQIGQATAFTKDPLYIGRGYEAPKAQSTSHHCGSQGRHR